MHPFSRRTVLKLLAAGSTLVLDDDQKTEPQYVAKDANIQFQCTADYPQRWKQVYQNTLEHFSKKWGRVGPTHVFLIENIDWKNGKPSPEKTARLKESQKKLRRVFCQLQGQDSDGEHLDWKTGNHWTGWSIQPANLMITMTMSPYRDQEQFVIGPMHEYLHVIQIVHGYAREAIQGNQMGHSLWTGPAWWREGSAVLVAALSGYQHPELFDGLNQPFTWRRFSGEMNRNLDFYQKGKTSIRRGVTHDDWQRLEPKKLVHPVVYCGGSVACALLLKKAGSLENFMKFFPQVAEIGWQKAFENHFKLELSAFYKEFERKAAAAKVQRDHESQKANWFSFLKSMD